MFYTKDKIIDPKERFSVSPKTPWFGIICHHPYIFSRLAKLKKEKIIDIQKTDKLFKDSYFSYKNIPIVLINAYFGQLPVVHRIFEYFARGTKVFLNFGACGAVNSNLKTGDLILVSEAERDGDITYAFSSESQKAKSDIKLNKIIKAQIKKMPDLTYIYGKIKSVNSIYSYSYKDLVNTQKDNILAFESESASSFIAAGWLRERYKSIYPKISSLLYVSDIIPRNKNETWISELDDKKKLLDYKEKCFLICLETIFHYQKSFAQASF